MKKALVVLVLLGALVGFGRPVSAGTVRSAEILEVGLLDPGTNCSSNPLFQVHWRTTGTGFGEFGLGSLVGTPSPDVGIVASPLFDNADVDATFGIILPGDQPEGSLIGGYAVIGDPSLDPAVTSEAFLLYRCADDAAESVELLTCIGPFGTCPKTVDEALRWPPALEVVPTADPEGLAISGTGCWDGSVQVTVTGAAGEVFLSAGVVVDALGGFDFGEVTIPPAAAGGTGTVTAVCSYPGSEPAVETFTITRAGPSTTATTVAPGAAQRTTPRFTG